MWGTSNFARAIHVRAQLNTSRLLVKCAQAHLVTLLAFNQELETILQALNTMDNRAARKLQLHAPSVALAIISTMVLEERTLLKSVLMCNNQLIFVLGFMAHRDSGHPAPKRSLHLRHLKLV